MFAWQSTLESLDIVPEQYRPLYSQGEGGFTLDADLAKRLDTSAINQALEKERKQTRELDKLLKAYSKHGKPEELEAKLEELQKSAAGSAGAADKFEKLKQDMLASHQKALAEKDTHVQAMRSAIERYVADAQINAALAEHKGNVALLRPHVRAQVKVLEEGGEYRAMVVDKDGDPRGDGKGGYMSIADLVAEMKSSKDYAVAFEPSGVSGSGTKPTASGRPPPAALEDMSPMELIRKGLQARRGQ